MTLRVRLLRLMRGSRPWTPTADLAAACGDVRHPRSAVWVKLSEMECRGEVERRTEVRASARGQRRRVVTWRRTDG